ncbi:ABC transporter permease [Thalassospira sp. MA62]|nr:ABC transporter permease [Thalassospira sp. MA62]
MSNVITRSPLVSQGLRNLRAAWLLTTANVTSIIGLTIFALVVIAAIFAPMIAQHSPVEQDLFSRLLAPSAEHWLGTDGYGRDIMARIIYGARLSLLIGVFSVACAIVVGSLIGLIAGYFGGRTDIILMQAMDVLLAFPSLILGLIVVVLIGPSVANIVIAIALTAVPPFARIARAPTMALRNREYVDAGRALGFSNRRIIFGHILPNIVPEILVMGSLWMATAIRVEASLAFIGLGVAPPTPTWGGMIREGFENILDSSWLAIFPSIAIFLVVLALNLVGDGLRDAIDPRAKGGK